MFRFLLIVSTILLINMVISYGVRYLLRDRYISHPGSLLEQACIQLSHLKMAFTDERLRYAAVGIFFTTLYSFVKDNAMSTEFYLLHFIVGICATMQVIYASLLWERKLPGSAPEKKDSETRTETPTEETFTSTNETSSEEVTTNESDEANSSEAEAENESSPEDLSK